jgi:hypothetical protein
MTAKYAWRDHETNEEVLNELKSNLNFRQNYKLLK